MNLIVRCIWLIFDINSSNCSVDQVLIMKMSSIDLFWVCTNSGAWFISCVSNLPMNGFVYEGAILLFPVFVCIIFIEFEYIVLKHKIY